MPLSECALTSQHRPSYDLSCCRKVMYDGIVSIQAILMKTFAKHGVEKIEPEVGAEMDPNRMMVSRESLSVFEQRVAQYLGSARYH